MDIKQLINDIKEKYNSKDIERTNILIKRKEWGNAKVLRISLGWRHFIVLSKTREIFGAYVFQLDDLIADDWEYIVKE